jgi:hypothetical protein
LIAGLISILVGACKVLGLALVIKFGLYILAAVAIAWLIITIIEALRRQRRKDRKIRKECKCVWLDKDNKGNDRESTEPSGQGALTLADCLAHCKSVEFGGRKLVGVIWNNIRYPVI